MATRRFLQPKVWVSSSNGSQGPRKRLRLSAAHDEWNHVGIALVAMEEGFFANEGLSDVELITFDETGSELLDREVEQVDLLVDGVVDIAIDPRTTFVIEANDQHKPVSIVAARRKNHAFVMVGQKGLKSVQDLRGMTLEGGHRGGATDVMMRQVLKDSGLEPEKDVQFSYFGGPMHNSAASYRSFIEGKHGPAKLTAPGQAEKLVQQGYPVLADLRKLYPSRHDRITAANENFVRENPELLKGFLKGMIKGCQYVLEKKNEERFKATILEAGFLTSEREQQSFQSLLASWHERVSRDLSIPVEGVQLIIDEQKKAGKISSSFKADDVLRLDALSQSHRELDIDQ